MGRLSIRLPWSIPSGVTSSAASAQSGADPEAEPLATDLASATLSDSGGPRFYVEIEDPHRIYSPGATVAGKIVLLLTKKQKVSAVQVDIHGFVFVKNLLLAGRSVTKDLCRLTIDLWAAEESGGASSAQSTSTGSSNSDTTYLFLPPGEHQFPFEFSLPTTGLLSSLTFERGNISYLVTGILKRPGRSKQLSSPQPLSVTVPVDVSQLPPAKVTRIAIDVAHRRRSSPGTPSKVIVQLELPAKGYIRGEEIHVRLAIKHQWLVQSSAGIILTLVRIARLQGADIDLQTFRKDLDQTVLPVYTDPKTLIANVVGTLRVPPDAFPTMRHPELVTFQYMLEMTMDVTGKRDLQKYVARDPAFTFIDTVELKQKSGIVSAWTEVVIGTARATLGNPELAAARPVSILTAAASDRSVHVDMLSLSSSVAPSPINTPPSAQQTAQEEKAELAAREAVLLPSAPPVEAVLHDVSAPGPSAPLGAAHGADKRELERQQLAEMASAPEDFVPRYEATPSAPSAPPDLSAPLPGPSAPELSVPGPSAPPSAPPHPADPISPSAPPASAE